MSGLKLHNEKIIFKNKLGFTLCQQNGQRTYGGPPPNWGSRPPPSRDSEVFIGRLPRMCFEDELIPLFLTAGELYEFRLMLDFSGTNRGYGYAHYATPEGAQRAIEKLNKYEIRPGHFIGVLKSKNNCRLLFGNIGMAMNWKTFNRFIRSVTDQVLNVLMFRSFDQLNNTEYRIAPEVAEAFLARMPQNSMNDHFAIVEYDNHKAAAVARRILVPRVGQVLTIDWAVPPRDRRRFNQIETQTPAIERPLSSTSSKDLNTPVLYKSNTKFRPVPVLLVQPSQYDNVPFMSKTLKTVIIFFKYQLSVCLYKSVDKMEIPLFICKEIERKIVDRITNVKNCSQAVQLIFNYFSWYNEKKPIVMNPEVQKLLQEVKQFADSFIVFINRKLRHEETPNPEEDNYFINVLPLHLNVLFRIILRSDPELQVKLSSGIAKGLQWVIGVMKEENKSSRDFINEILNLINSQDAATVEKGSTLAKSLFLSTITSQKQNAVLMNLSSINNGASGLNNNQKSFSPDSSIIMQKGPSNLNSQLAKGNPAQFVPRNFPQGGRLNEEASIDENFYPPVPLLLVQPSIMNKVPFMPETFNNLVNFFKLLIKNSVIIFSWQMNVPQQILSKIERRIISRISNMENCSEAVQLILNYFTLWNQKFNDQTFMNLEAQNHLQEIKTYADSFVNFVWSKTMSVYIPNETAENFFCKTLPLKLNFLFHIMLIFNTENSPKFLFGITKGLEWLEQLFQNGEATTQLFLKELARYIKEGDLDAYERAKSLGKAICSEYLNVASLSPNFNEPNNNQQDFSLRMNLNAIINNFPNSIPNMELPNFSISSSDSASDATFD